MNARKEIRDHLLVRRMKYWRDIARCPLMNTKIPTWASEKKLLALVRETFGLSETDRTERDQRFSMMGAARRNAAVRCSLTATAPATDLAATGRQTHSAGPFRALALIAPSACSSFVLYDSVTSYSRIFRDGGIDPCPPSPAPCFSLYRVDLLLFAAHGRPGSLHKIEQYLA
jgi:hypothetical protein